MNDIKLINDDCIKIMKTMPDNSITTCITDIPYGEVNRQSNGLRNLDKGIADITTFPINEFLNELTRIISGSIYIFCGTEQVSEIRKKLVENKFSTRLIIWEKTNPSPMNGKHIWLSGIECCVFGKKKGATFNEHCKNTVFRYPCGRNKMHPTQKPLELIKKLILASTNKGDTVFDPCMGSGTTGVGCIELGREFIGVEIDFEYYKVAQDRIINSKQIIIDDNLAVNQ